MPTGGEVGSSWLGRNSSWVMQMSATNKIELEFLFGCLEEIMIFKGVGCGNSKVILKFNICSRSPFLRWYHINVESPGGKRQVLCELLITPRKKKGKFDISGLVMNFLMFYISNRCGCISTRGVPVKTQWHLKECYALAKGILFISNFRFSTRSLFFLLT